MIRREDISFDATEWRMLQLSFSQIGEDRVLLHLLGNGVQAHGTYVDVGAFHPVQYSNTLLLYKLGWRGVNIDANPTIIDLFNLYRPDDKNVCAAVSDSVKQVRYLYYPAGATNRINENGLGSPLSVIGELPSKTEVITTRTLSSILEEVGLVGRRVDFLNVDCEGADLDVLKGLDWKQWRPRVVAVESQREWDCDTVISFLHQRGYSEVARMFVTQIFVLRES